MTTASGQPAFATGVAGPAFSTGGATVAGATQAAGTARARNTASTPSQRAAIGNAWTGNQLGQAPSLMSDSASSPSGGTGSQLGLGLGLLGFGVLALIAGLTAAEVRRRRAM